LNLQRRSLAHRDSLLANLRGLGATGSSGQQAPGHHAWPLLSATFHCSLVRRAPLPRWEYKGYRSCLGILRLAKRYGSERLEAACARAGAVEARSYRHVDSILKHGLDRLALPATLSPLTLPPVHEHVRGRDYYL
jgi:hypothetical protein